MNTQPLLFSPLALRGLTLKNRIVVSPMCQYSASDGIAGDWHLVHLGSRAAGGAGAVFVEATAVTPEGRISPLDVGLWNDTQAAALARIARFIESMNSAPAIQLAHAGRKASCAPPLQGGARIKSPSDGGWDPVAPTAISFHAGDPPPLELDASGIAAVQDAFAAAARRAVQAGFRIIEIHAAHGYLLHEFLSPLSNRRADGYGGSLENRMRMLLETAVQVRAAIPADIPLFVRISATDWAEGGWDLAQSVALAKALRPLGVDLIDCSSGALVPNVHVPVAPGYQVPFAETIRREAGIATGAVGMITEPAQAEEILAAQKADLVLLARQMLREPYWALDAARALGAQPEWPAQYGYAVARR